MPTARTKIVAQLQQDILRMEGFRPSVAPVECGILGPLQSVFQHDGFPRAAIHEFLPEDKACATSATGAFVAGLISPLLANGGLMLWVSASRKLFPPSLTGFGVRPDQVIFIDVRSPRNVLWATEESLKCSAVTAVVAEVGSLDLASSRRLQLAVEQSRSTGFLIRSDAQQPGITASLSRWQIAPVPGSVPDGLPGVGYPEWRVELLRLRNGRPGTWRIRWKQGRFEEVAGMGHGEVGTGDDRKAG